MPSWSAVASDASVHAWLALSFQSILAAGCWLEGFAARELASSVRPCDFLPFSRVLWGVRVCVASPCRLLVFQMLQPVVVGLLTLHSEPVIPAIGNYVWVSHDICWL